MDDFFPTLVVAYLVGFLPAMMFANHLHQLGHAVAGRRLGYRVRIAGSGLGRLLLQSRVGGVTWVVGRERPTVAYALAVYPATVAPRSREVPFLLSGPLLTLTAGVGLFAAAYLVGGGPVAAGLVVVGFFCGMDGVVNLVPMRAVVNTATAVSDGGRVVGLLTGRPWVRRAEAVGTVRAIAALADEAGDAWLAAHLRRAGALAWAALGVPGPARELLAEAGEPGDEPFERGTAELAAGWVALAAGEASAVRHAAAAETHFAEAGDTTGRWLAGFVAAVADPSRTVPEGGDRPEVAPFRMFADLLPRLRVGEAAEELIDRLDALPDAVRDPGVLTVLLNRAAGWGGSDRLRQRAAGEAADTATALLHPADRASYDAAWPRGEFDPPPAGEVEALRQRRLYRKAWVVVAATFLVGTLGLGGSLLAGVLPPAVPDVCHNLFVAAACLLPNQILVLGWFGVYPRLLHKAGANYGLEALVVTLLVAGIAAIGAAVITVRRVLEG